MSDERPPQDPEKLREWIRRREDQKPTQKLPQLPAVVREHVEVPPKRRDPRAE